MGAERSLTLRPEEAWQLSQLHKKYPDGVHVKLLPGTFQLSETVRIRSRTIIEGCGPDQTKIVLLPQSDCHIFTNASHEAGNSSITIKDVSIDGSGDQQKKPEGLKSLTFACAVYMRKVQSVLLENCHFHNIRQTAAHFNGSLGVVIKGLRASGLGWSGVSTSDSSNVWMEAYVEHAGLDIMHSAVHIDGGVGVYVDANVLDTTGNGVMLDSTYAPLNNVVVRGRGMRCRRGLAISGASEKELRNVYVEGTYSDNRETGIMISNAKSVVINSCDVQRNGDYGILFQGRSGGKDCLVVNSNVTQNAKNFEHLHGSGDNWVFEYPLASRFVEASQVNAGSFKDKKIPPWVMP